MSNTLLQDKKSTKLYADLLEDDIYVVLDIETTGFSPNKGSEIIELAAVKVIRGRITDTYSSLIKPNSRIPANIKHITGISNEMVKGAPVYTEVLNELLSFMGNSTIVAHNSSFEKRFLNHYYNTIGVELENEWICTMNLFNELYPERKRLSLGSKLEDLTDHYNINFSAEEQHRALPDTMVTAYAFLEMRKELLDDTYIEEELLLDTDISISEVTASGIETFNFTSINYWEKCLNHKRERWGRRLYIRFTSPGDILGDIYYDLYTKSYHVQKVQYRYTREDVQVNMDEFERELLKYLNVSDINTYLKKTGVFRNAQRMFINRIKDKKEYVKVLYDTENVIHVDYVKREIPYDIFEIDGDARVLVTNEKRGSKYRHYYREEDIK